MCWLRHAPSPGTAAATAGPCPRRTARHTTTTAAMAAAGAARPSDENSTPSPAPVRSRPCPVRAATAAPRSAPPRECMRSLPRVPGGSPSSARRMSGPRLDATNEVPVRGVPACVLVCAEPELSLRDHRITGVRRRRPCAQPASRTPPRHRTWPAPSPNPDDVVADPVLDGQPELRPRLPTLRCTQRRLRRKATRQMGV